MSNRILHCGAERVSRFDLRDIPTPEPTKTWKPVSHFDVASLIASEASKRYEIVSEDYGLSKDGSQMFGVLKFHPEGRREFTRCLGTRNSLNKTLSLGVTVGLNILVCDNLCFGGETTIQRKHTSGIDIDQLIPRAFTELEYQYTRLEIRNEELKMQRVTIDKARVITVMAAEKKIIPSCDIVPVVEEYRNPRHDEFKERNKFNLYQAFTEICKKYSAPHADRCYKGLANLFELT
jgi:hypothetical protein